MSHREYRLYERRLDNGDWELICRVLMFPGEQMDFPVHLMRKGFEYKVDNDMPCDDEVE
jgi:hypothetical protein